MFARRNRGYERVSSGGLAIALGLMFASVCIAECLQLSCPAKFVLSMADGDAGRVWVGTEDSGLFCVNPATNQWKQFKARDGLGDDNAYAIAVDRLGRVWCGTLNHGVSVFNGKEWRTYGIGDGPLGERVFDIRCSPADGDVWTATSAGLARYRNRSNQWSYYTRLNGLPADQVQCLAFNPQGDVFAGLQCGGVAIARASERHTQWTVSAAPWTFDKEQRTPYPTEPEGDGLPSNLINALLIARDGTVWAATAAGLAWSRDDGRSWRYRRGRDFADRVRGALGGAPKGWKPPAKEAEARLLPEDYVTCLAEGADGTLWVGFREKGCAALDAKTAVVRQLFKPYPNDKAAPLRDGYVNRLLALPDGGVLAGCYGGGVVRLEPAWISDIRPADTAAPTRPAVLKSAVPFPSPAAAPDDAQLGRWTAYRGASKKSPCRRARPRICARTGARKATGSGATGSVTPCSAP